MIIKTEPIYTGIINKYNQQYGFIEYDTSAVFFHRSDITAHKKLNIGDIVTFTLKPSNKKVGTFAASQVTKKPRLAHSSTPLINAKYKLGRILWYSNKGFGKVEGLSNTFPKDKYAEYIIRLTEESQDQKPYEILTNEFFFRTNLGSDLYHNYYHKGAKCIYQPNFSNLKASNVVIISENLYESLHDTIFENHLCAQAIINELISNPNINTKYHEIIKLLHILVELNQDITDLVNVLYNKPDHKLKFLLWVNKFTTNIHWESFIHLFSEHNNFIYKNLQDILDIPIEPFDRFKTTVFNRLLEQENHESILQHLIDLLPSIQAQNKDYDIISFIAQSKKLSEQEKAKFCIQAFPQCNSALKIKLCHTFLKDLTLNEEKQIEEKQIEEKQNTENLNEISISAMDFSEIITFITKELLSIEDINTGYNFQQVKTFLDIITNLGHSVNNMVNQLLEKSNRFFKLLLWYYVLS